jgi:hypothetical protein
MFPFLNYYRIQSENLPNYSTVEFRPKDLGIESKKEINYKFEITTYKTYFQRVEELKDYVYSSHNKIFDDKESEEILKLPSSHKFARVNFFYERFYYIEKCGDKDKSFYDRCADSFLLGISEQEDVGYVIVDDNDIIL